MSHHHHCGSSARILGLLTCNLVDSCRREEDELVEQQRREQLRTTFYSYFDILDNEIANLPAAPTEDKVQKREGLLAGLKVLREDLLADINEQINEGATCPSINNSLAFKTLIDTKEFLKNLRDIPPENDVKTHREGAVNLYVNHLEMTPQIKTKNFFKSLCTVVTAAIGFIGGSLCLGLAGFFAGNLISGPPGGIGLGAASAIVGGGLGCYKGFQVGLALTGIREHMAGRFLFGMRDRFTEQADNIAKRAEEIYDCPRTRPLGSL